MSTRARRSRGSTSTTNTAVKPTSPVNVDTGFRAVFSPLTRALHRFTNIARQSARQGRNTAHGKVPYSLLFIAGLAGTASSGYLWVVLGCLWQSFALPGNPLVFAAGGGWKTVGVATLFSVTSVSLYLALGYVLYYNWYICRKDDAESWKCQPNRWPSSSELKYQITLGSVNVGAVAFLSGIITCYIANGGYTSLYWDLDAQPRWWLFLSPILLFLWIDATAYYTHWLVHHPRLYKHMHKVHHTFKAPTPWSLAALHPLEFIIFQSYIAAPVFLMPCHMLIYALLIVYIYYYGMLDHSGIHIDSIFPWQPSVVFHDDHHRYFHTNYGFNTAIFDHLHGTMRDENRVYVE